jgi:4-hydroxy-3-methylbut-2-en-1-yl diphosphate reductase
MTAIKNKVKKIILAEPRGFCAGVNRAIDIVDIALDLYSPPIYVRHEIVHNHHVVKDFEERGVIFIEDLDEVPDNAKLIFSAHGTSPDTLAKAKARGLEFIDAVCPLVTKVHLEIKKALKAKCKVIYIGHRGHQEVLGAMGYSETKIDMGQKTYSQKFNPDQDIYLVESVEDVIQLEQVIGDKESIVATQTTLSLNDTEMIIAKLKELFPRLHLPKSEDICYATTNRQDAVAELVKLVDYVLIIGSKNSSNTLRLLELAQALGKESQLVPDPENFIVDQGLYGKTIGISSGASAPEFLVDALIAKLFQDPEYQYSKGSDKKYEDQIEILNFKEEKVSFSLPKELL